MEPNIINKSTVLTLEASDIGDFGVLRIDLIRKRLNS